MIKKIIIQSRVTEVNNVSTRMSGAFEISGLTDPYMVSTFTELGTVNIKLTLAINRSKAESDLKTKDLLRDNKIRALYYLLLSCSLHPNEETRDAALLLLKVFNNYGLAMIRESYATLSSLISSMLMDFAKPEYAGAIEAVPGCGDLLESLGAAQTDFEQARIAYDTEKAMLGMQDNATVLKQEVVKIINGKIVVYLRAMVQVNPEMFGFFTGICKQIIDDSNEQVKKRKKKPEPEVKTVPESITMQNSSGNNDVGGIE